MTCLHPTSMAIRITQHLAACRPFLPLTLGPMPVRVGSWPFSLRGESLAMLRHVPARLSSQLVLSCPKHRGPVLKAEKMTNILVRSMAGPRQLESRFRTGVADWPCGVFFDCISAFSFGLEGALTRSGGAHHRVCRATQHDELACHGLRPYVAAGSALRSLARMRACWAGPLLVLIGTRNIVARRSLLRMNASGVPVPYQSTRFGCGV